MAQDGPKIKTGGSGQKKEKPKNYQKNQPKFLGKSQKKTKQGEIFNPSGKLMGKSWKSGGNCGEINIGYGFLLETSMNFTCHEHFFVCKIGSVLKRHSHFLTKKKSKMIFSFLRTYWFQKICTQKMKITKF